MSNPQSEMENKSYTMINNYFIDNILNKLSGNAAKIFIIICRKTIGWHKECDKLSNKQLSILTGINSRHTLLKAIQELIKLKLIEIKRSGQGKAIQTFYSVNINGAKNALLDFNGAKIALLNAPNRAKIAPLGDSNGAKIAPTKDIYIKKVVESMHFDSAPALQADACPPQQLERENCPYEKIWKIYRLYLVPSLPDCIVLSSTRKTRMRLLWQAALPKLEDWEFYFKKVAASNFLMGKIKKKDKEPFRCTFDWLLEQSNVIKVLETTYDNNRR